MPPPTPCLPIVPILPKRLQPKIDIGTNERLDKQEKTTHLPFSRSGHQNHNKKREKR